MTSVLGQASLILILVWVFHVETRILVRFWTIRLVRVVMSILLFYILEAMKKIVLALKEDHAMIGTSS